MTDLGHTYKTFCSVTCLDPRCVPEQYFGPGFRGAVFRNAGGRATDDVVRSLTDLRALVNMKTVLVVHHTGLYICCSLDFTSLAKLMVQIAA